MEKNILGRVLIVDDEADLLDIFKSELELQGLEVHIATNGLEALEELDHNKFDVVITDICMPWMNGADFIKQLREAALSSRTFVFAISGHSLYSEEQLKELGASALIQKPFDYKNVIEVIKGHVMMIRTTEQLAPLAS